MAIIYYDKALKIRTTIFGEENVDVADSYMIIGKNYLLFNNSLFII